MSDWQYFPAILMGPGPDGGYAVEVIGNGINGSGTTSLAALTDAALILQEVIDDAIADREPAPVPREASDAELARGTLAMLPARLAVEVAI